MKGISPIIAIIIILLITIAIAGAAYSYISVIWVRTAEGVQLISSDCTRTDATNSNATFIFRNVGTKVIPTLTLTRTNPSGAGTVTTPTSVDPGAISVTYDEACPTGSMCIYKIMAGGQVQELYAQC